MQGLHGGGTAAAGRGTAITATSAQSQNSAVAAGLLGSSDDDEDDEDDEVGFDVAPDEDLDEDLPMEQGDETQNDFLDETVPDSTAASILASMRSRPPTRRTAGS